MAGWSEQERQPERRRIQGSASIECRIPEQRKFMQYELRTAGRWVARIQGGDCSGRHLLKDEAEMLR